MGKLKVAVRVDMSFGDPKGSDAYLEGGGWM